MVKQKFQNQTVSVILRFHDEDLFPLLEQALFSLATQSYQDLQLIIVVQNGSLALLTRIRHILSKLPFSSSVNFIVEQVGVEQSKDGRSLLLNEGIKLAQGRFIAFLDYDDVVYPNAYELLVNKALSSNNALIVGGARRAHHQVADASFPYYNLLKESYPLVFSDGGFERLFLMEDNFIPINSYIIDRNFIEEELSFDTSLSIFEDYLFLLKLTSRYSFNFDLMNIPVAEYRLRTNDSNTNVCYSSSREKKQRWDESWQYVDNQKKSFKISISMWDIAQFVRLYVNPLQHKHLTLGDEYRQLEHEYNCLQKYKSELQHYIKTLEAQYDILHNERQAIIVKVAIKIQKYIARFPWLERLLTLPISLVHKFFKSIASKP